MRISISRLRRLIHEAVSMKNHVYVEHTYDYGMKGCYVVTTDIKFNDRNKAVTYAKHLAQTMGVSFVDRSVDRWEDE